MIENQLYITFSKRNQISFCLSSLFLKALIWVHQPLDQVSPGLISPSSDTSPWASLLCWYFRLPVGHYLFSNGLLQTFLIQWSEKIGRYFLFDPKSICRIWCSICKTLVWKLVYGFAKGKQRIRVGNQGEHPRGSFSLFLRQT